MMITHGKRSLETVRKSLDLAHSRSLVAFCRVTLEYGGWTEGKQTQRQYLTETTILRDYFSILSHFCPDL